jgi:FKBP-type peptidyl-prolyl cis-trans isomerase
MSCTQQQPQLPANKGNIIDSTASNLLAINKALAAKEDSILSQYAKRKDKTFLKTEIGLWYKINQVSKGRKLANRQSCRFTYRLMTLENQVLEEKERICTIGKKEMIAGLEEGLKIMHIGESATFIIPWYLAYGMSGNKPLIPPYTSLILAVTLIE